MSKAPYVSIVTPVYGCRTCLAQLYSRLAAVLTRITPDFEIIMVNDPEAFNTVCELAKMEGVLAGSSGGANAYAALQIANRLGPGKRVVTIIPDSAERYMSKNIFEGGI